MSAAYNLAKIRQLLTDAFNAGEIKTLAFDLFPAVYGDFAAGMTKGQMIRAVVDHASRFGHLPRLLDYARNNNPYQYQRFANQLMTATPVIQSDFGYKQRWQDLQGHIKRELELLREYEILLSDARDPREKRRCRGEIERQKESLANYQQQLNELEAEVKAASGAAPTEEPSLMDVMAGIAAMQKQINQVETNLAAGQQTIRDDIRRQRQAILAHIAAQHRQTLAALVEKMDADQLELTELLLDAADRRQIAQWEAEQLTRLSQQALVDLKRLRQNQPDAAQWQSMLDLLARETGWQQKLKLTLPLIPGIVAFESEMTMDVVPALKQAWQRLANKIRR